MKTQVSLVLVKVTKYQNDQFLIIFSEVFVFEPLT